MKIRFWMAALCMALAPVVSAQEATQGVFVQGEGRISVAPDQAIINLGVRENAKTAAAAMQAMAQSVSGILAALEDQGIASADQQTSRFYLNPIYIEARLDQGRQVSGYEAGNAVTGDLRRGQ